MQLMVVQNHLKDERKTREVMETRIVRELKMIKEGIMALVSMQSLASHVRGAAMVQREVVAQVH